MSKKPDYTADELIKLYVKKTEDLGHIPLSSEIEDDPDMPAYITYLRMFNTGEEIVKQAKLPAKYHHLARINNQFCNDCLHDPRNCGCEIQDCKEMATLYFRLEDRKVKL
ncbi:MAG: hypothetical protein FH762_01145 [Firmicutes bacterium]|nr:hypothetical protein [Bacillota bacterium]